MFGSLRRLLSSDEIGGRVSEAGFFGRCFVAVGIVAVTISFFTTSKGVDSFFGADSKNALAFWGALAIAGAFGFVIQVTLAGSSWLLGRDLGQYVSRQKDQTPTGRSNAVTLIRVLVMLAMFVPAMGLSIFLSFDTYFNALYHGAEENRLQRARVPPFISEVVSDLKKKIDTTRGSATDALKADVLNGWLPTLDKVALEASQAEPLIQQALKQEADARQKRITQQQLDKQKADQQRKSAERKEAETKAILNENLPEKIDLALKERNQQADRLKDLQARRDPLLKRLWITITYRDGRKERVKVAKVAKELAPIEQEIGQVKASIQDKDRNIALMTDRQNKANTEHANAVGELGTLDKAVSEPDEQTSSQPQTITAQSWRDVTTAVASLKRIRAALELKANLNATGGDTDTQYKDAETPYKAAIDTCNALVKVLRSKQETAKRVEGVACDPQALGAIKKFDQQDKIRRRFDTECDGIDRNKPRTFDEALNDARKCRSLAQDAGMADIVSVNKRIREFEESFSTDRGEFSKAMSAFDLSLQMALLALVFSLVQDLVLLGASIFVEITRGQRRQEEMTEDLVSNVDLTLYPGEDPATHAAKIIIGNSNATKDDPPRYAFDTESNTFEKLSDGLRATVRSVITGLVQQGLARADHGSPGQATVYHLTSSGLFELRRMLRARVSSAPDQRRDRNELDLRRRRAARGGDSPVEVASRRDARPVSAQSEYRVGGTGSSRDDLAGRSAPGFQVFTPAELWRLDRSSVVEYLRASNDTRPAADWNAEPGYGFGTEASDVGTHRRTNDNFADLGSVDGGFSNYANSTPRDEINDTTFDRTQSGQASPRNRTNSSADVRRTEDMWDSNRARGKDDFGSKAAPSLDELRAMEQAGRRK